jgi:hypothetical protein
VQQPATTHTPHSQCQGNEHAPRRAAKAPSNTSKSARHQHHSAPGLAQPRSLPQTPVTPFRPPSLSGSRPLSTAPFLISECARICRHLIRRCEPLPSTLNPSVTAGPPLRSSLKFSSKDLAMPPATPSTNDCPNGPPHQPLSLPGKTTITRRPCPSLYALALTAQHHTVSSCLYVATCTPASTRRAVARSARTLRAPTDAQRREQDANRQAASGPRRFWLQ